MPLQTDTLSTIVDRAKGDINANIKGADSRLRRAVLGAIAYMLGKFAWGFYRFLAYVARQRLADTMDDDNLANYGGLTGVPQQGASFATGTVTLGGSVGEPVPTAPPVLLQTQGGVEVQITAGGAIGGDGTLIVQVQAVVAGSAGNLANGTQLTFVSPLAGVNANATVVAMSGGLDVEDLANYRGRIIDHDRSPPQGGTESDYVQWARSQPGVTRAWPAPDYMGPGTIGVFFVFDGRANIYPTTNDVAAMQAFLETKAPQGDTVYAVAPVANPIAHTIQLANPADANTQAAIVAELTDLYSRLGGPASTIDVSFVRDAVGLGAGAMAWRLIVPAANVTNGAVQMPTLGAITWQGIP